MVVVGICCIVSYCSSFSFISPETQASIVHVAADRHTHPTFMHTNKTGGRKLVRNTALDLLAAVIVQ